MVNEKIKVIPFDLVSFLSSAVTLLQMRLDLGFSTELRQELTQNLNIIINAAASMDFDEQLDVAVRINTTGVLLLLKLAEESRDIEALL